ncbi:phospholipid carrier-dependent glycosyltransferase [Altererythrobacter xixiisoli]|uniref:Polyprenol-phosphate-mannose--protein mannosyltransferase n=1 Tax=Croceibacterium xixiisoli TaxID=1476466 RepID=A0A6I4TW51_9SPHN|nr:phospholipid carrier-dependent glycosyltransferase [Croceibacterium xixiisoli]MXO98818.1 phospholipid carrier-dependent glycosyltransferase [Croceibacterium xixiisoli]
MPQPSANSHDPIGWTALLTLIFAGLCLVRLTIPSHPFFDEVHYLPAARVLLEGGYPINREHPPLGKEWLALGMWLLGDRPIGWRLLPALAGVAALWAAMRAMWLASGRRMATILFGVLLITAIPLLVQSRIAMLDIFMIAPLMIALWLCAGAMRAGQDPEAGTLAARWRLALAGVALGCAMAAKWNAAPLAMLPGIAFLIARFDTLGLKRVAALPFTRQGAPISGISVAEAALWLGLVPLLVYAASYWPFYTASTQALEGPWALVTLHQEMLGLQQQKLAPHTYQSVWYEWVGNLRAIWYLYEPADGAQRGVLLVGHPLTMLIALPAMAWCCWMGLERGRRDALAVFVLYAVSLGLWIVANKNVQFYYHYVLPSCFLMGGLALALDALWEKRGWMRWLVIGVLVATLGIFAWFWPIVSAAELTGEQSFLWWTWLDSWR